MKKQLSAILLIACLLLSVPVHAETDSVFPRTKTYAAQFSDLSEASPFYANVSALYEYGLSVGKPDGTYGLTDSLTVGQAIIFAGRIRSLYRTGDAEAGAAAYRTEGQPAAVPYLLYLQAEGVLDHALDDALTSAATRAQIAHVLANLLPDDILPPVYTEQVSEAYATRRFITDVTEYTPYQQDILALYRRGVSIGSDENGSFHPEAPITRGAAAAMLTRMLDASLRQVPLWMQFPTAQGMTLESLVTPGRRLTAPATAADMDEAVRRMLSAGENTLQLKYPALTAERAQTVVSLALNAVKTHCEQSYNHVSCTYTTAGAATLTFSATGFGSDTAIYRAEALSSAIAVHDKLWQDGTLHSDMTQLEKARVYYTWVCENAVYDTAAGDISLSHIPYGLFETGLAVCDGYTGAYNLLLKLEGIDCRARIQGDHIWTIAVLDGTEYHIDTTWGDSGSVINYTWFAMTPQQSALYHK